VDEGKFSAPTRNLNPFLSVKRFTETTKWGQAWFRRLSTPGKLLWQYLHDNCDNAGVVEPDFELATFQIGEPVQEKNLAEFGQRVQRLPNGKLWLAGFITEQFGDLTGTSNVHKSVIKLISFHHLKHPIPSIKNGQVIERHPQAMPMTSGRRPTPPSKGKGKGIGKGKERGVGKTNSPVMHNSFAALKIANRILANETGWHYDNCKVVPDQLKSGSLQTVILSFVGKLSDTQILSCWATAVKLTHAGLVRARNSTRSWTTWTVCPSLAISADQSRWAGDSFSPGRLASTYRVRHAGKAIIKSGTPGTFRVRFPK
jgi:hypothetical protein